MSRYVKGSARPPHGWYDYDAPLCPDLYVADAVAVNTGLVWPTGEPIMRVPNPIGFGRDDEW
jgi:hypothetical protein